MESLEAKKAATDRKPSQLRKYKHLKLCSKPRLAVFMSQLIPQRCSGSIVDLVPKALTERSRDTNPVDVEVDI